MNQQSNAEIERLRGVYDEYKNDATKQRHWSDSSPSTKYIKQERDRLIEKDVFSRYPSGLQERRILEIGCGFGNNLAAFERLGVPAEQCYGVDILEDRVEEAKHKHPAMTFMVENAEQLSFEDSTFDAILVFTVFTSILDPAMRSNIAREIDRVLKSGGYILWYDFRYNNPRNKHVRGISRSTIKELFPQYDGIYRTVTLIPPLARLFGKSIAFVYPILRLFPVLRSHYLAFLTKPS